MLVVDVSVLVYAHRRELPEHGETGAWLTSALAGAEKVGIADPVWLGTYRLVTNPRIFKAPATPEVALKFLGEVTGAPAAIRVVATEACMERVATWAAKLQLRGDRVPDAFLASLAVDLDATLVTCDRGFGGYPGLRWKHPLEGRTQTNPR